jgi:hypothetical protein
MNKWDDSLNERRCELIDKEIAGTLNPSEKAELQTLQEAFLMYRKKVAPLPLDDAKELLSQLQSAPLNTYQITLPGYDGSTDRTDHLIKWVNAPCLEDAQVFARSLGVEISTVELLEGRKLGFEDGVDFIIGSGGEILDESPY